MIKIRTLLYLLGRIKYIFFAVWLLAVAAFLIGLLYGLKNPSATPISSPFDPVPNIVYSRSLGKPLLFTTILGGNLLNNAILLLSSFLHLGIGKLLFFLYLPFRWGGTLAWFATYPGGSVVNGIKAFSIHVIPELLASSLVTSLSLWFGIGIIKPDTGCSRINTFKQRLGMSLILVPVIVSLLIVAALLEGFVSISLAYDAAQTMIIDEPMNEVHDPDYLDRWKMEVPRSWFEPNDVQVPGRFAMYVNMTAPMAVDVRMVQQQGEIPWEKAKQDMMNGFTASHSKQGYSIRPDSNEDIILDGQPAHRFIAVGTEKLDPLFKGRDMVIVTYMVSKFNPKNNLSTGYGINFQVDRDYYEFERPQMDQIIKTFRMN